jgi:hypothetical protein
VDRGHEAAKKLIDEAKKNQEKDPLKNALAAFYLKAATGQDNSVEFFHKSFGEFLMAERLAESFWLWTEKSAKRQVNYTVKDTELDWEIYDLLGYGLLTKEILGYLMPLLKLGEPSDYLENNNTFTATDWVSLFERLYAFYLRWSQGEFIEALESSSNILPLNKAAQLQQYQIPLGQRQADIYTGLNILSLLLLINTHAQSQADLNKKIHFYPCGNPDNAEELDRLRLLKIIGYSECLGAFTFCRKLGDFLSNVNLSNAYLRYANLSNADLSNTDLAVIRWDQETNWQGVRGLDTARNVPEALKQQLGLIDNG